MIRKQILDIFLMISTFSLNLFLPVLSNISNDVGNSGKRFSYIRSFSISPEKPKLYLNQSAIANVHTNKAFLKFLSGPEVGFDFLSITIDSSIVHHKWLGFNFRYFSIKFFYFMSPSLNQYTRPYREQKKKKKKCWSCACFNINKAKQK